jgi:hypothetical protein
LARLNALPAQSSRQTSQPRRGDTFVVRDSHFVASSVRSGICRPAGAERFLVRFDYKDSAPNGAMN